ncbi:hypothetical protein [Kocuria sp. SM24M-10]|uniref:hypothetical protein n=1 Tax=Kocuria sp. SM24M-10 TaxID=1660349 RepID=UPI00128E08AB|nr:hypothetical protein [Kocuria sp. SM24M-10]
MTSSMRRSRAAALRLALLSALTALGWLLLGATGASAAEGPVGGLGHHLGGTVRDVLQPAPPAESPVPAPASPVELRTGPLVEEVTGTVGGLTGAVEGLAVPLADAVDSTVAAVPVVGGIAPSGTVGTPARETTGLVEGLSGTVEAAARPVTGTVDEVLVQAPVVGQDPVPGLPPLVPAPGVAPVPSAPQTAPLDAGSPAEAPGTPVPPTSAPSRDGVREAQVLDGAVAAPAERAPAGLTAPAVAGDPAAAAARLRTETVTPAAAIAPRAGVISPADLLRALVVPPGGSGAVAAAQAPAEAGVHAGGQGVGTAGTSSSSSGSGGTGSPFGDSGAGAWPGMPGEAVVLDLTARSTADGTELLRGAAEDLPAPPAFDPGSTPD